jgi:hypothetical protein
MGGGAKEEVNNFGIDTFYQKGGKQNTRRPRKKKDKKKRVKEKEGRAAYFLYGCRLGGGVLYRMFVTASSADRDLGKSILGSGGGLTLCEFL